MATKHVSRWIDWSRWTSDRKDTTPAEPFPSDHYYYVTQRPWPSLLFVLPMLITFEVGTYFWSGSSPHGSHRLVATYLIDALINLFGQTAFFLPPLLTVVILFSSHVAARHPWRFDIFVLPGMLGESLTWTVPLLVFDRIMHTTALVATTAPYNDRVLRILQSLGAGLYEELVFRLMCITGLMILLVNVCRVPRGASIAFSIAFSAGLFAASHHQPIGSDPFNLASFVFRTSAGIFLAGLFVYRGFGIACGCHAFYNVLVETIRAIYTAPSA
jgi:hypothetical protein